MDNAELERLGEIKVDDEISIVAFLDILGFKNHVKNYLNPNYKSDKEILNNIKSAYENALNSLYASIFEYTGLNIKYKQFSDCTCLSIPNFRGNSRVAAIILCSFIYVLREFYFDMFSFDLYIRGGLSFGFHYEDDNMIFSEGLIKAHELESKAIYPRIILDNDITERFKKCWIHHKDTISLLGCDKILILDEDGTVFINPFNLSHALTNMILEGHTKKPSMYDENKDLKTNITQIDYNTQIRILKNLESNIQKLKSDKSNVNILKKYIWLKELVKWNIEPKSSRIKFEYLLK